MNEYPVGNKQILKSFDDGSFDEKYALQVLNNVDLNEPICDLNGYSTTYLYEAVSANNLPAVSFLLEHGADPNLDKPELICDCPLWQLQYIEDDQDWKTRYEIAKLFFRYGADPNLESEGETLYDYIVFKVYNDTPRNDNDWENLRHFYKLLVAYGGGGGDGHYPKPQLTGVNPDRIDDYDIELSWHDDHYHIIGNLVDKEGNDVGRL